MMSFRAGRYHRIPFHQLDEAKKQLGVKFHEYTEWLTFDEYVDLLKMFKNLGTDYWYATRDTHSTPDGKHTCRFGFVNQKDALAFKLMIDY